MTKGFRPVLSDAWTGHRYLEGGNEPLERISRFEQLPEFPTELLHYNPDFKRVCASIADDFDEISKELVEHFGPSFLGSRSRHCYGINSLTTGVLSVKSYCSFRERRRAPR